MTVARIYARFSTENQDRLSITDQVRVCRQYAAARGWVVAQEYSDEAISGAALGNRPGARAALADLQPTEVLIVNDLERLARSQDLAPLIARLKFRRVRVIAVQSAFDSDSRTARMQAGLSGIMSEEYRAQIALRTHSSLELRARTGGKTGGKALADEVLIRELFERFAGGESMLAIVSDLNRRGVPSPGSTWNRQKRRKDGRWLVSGLRAILRNDRYAGRVVWNRYQWLRDPDSGKRSRVLRPESEWIVREVPRLIDAETWAAVQARFRTGAGKSGRRNYLLSGLLTCDLCGCSLVIKGGTPRRYVCGSYHHGGPHACSNDSTFLQAEAELLLLADVRAKLLSPEAVEMGVREMREARREERGPVAPDEVRTLERMVREGLLSREVAAPAIAEARRKAQERGETQPVSLSSVPSTAVWRAAVAAMCEILAGDDVEASREVVANLTGPMRCRPDGDAVIVEFQTRRIALATGTGPRIWDGSGGLICSHIRIPQRRRFGARAGR